MKKMFFPLLFLLLVFPISLLFAQVSNQKDKGDLIPTTETNKEGKGDLLPIKKKGILTLPLLRSEEMCANLDGDTYKLSKTKPIEQTDENLLTFNCTSPDSDPSQPYLKKKSLEAIHLLAMNERCKELSKENTYYLEKYKIIYSPQKANKDLYSQYFKTVGRIEYTCAATPQPPKTKPLTLKEIITRVFTVQSEKDAAAESQSEDAAQDNVGIEI